MSAAQQNPPPASELDFIADFLTHEQMPPDCDCILTNPPYRWAGEFVAHALRLAPLVIMLVRLAFLESERRSAILDDAGLARVSLFKNRLSMMHRDGWSGPKASSAIPFCWLAWERATPARPSSIAFAGQWRPSSIRGHIR